ncbi:MAG: hypothetical protein RR182_01150 [Alistipes sp.]
MLDIKKGDRVFYGGRKYAVRGTSDTEVKLRGLNGWEYVAKSDVKPVVRLTPLVRAVLVLGRWGRRVEPTLRWVSKELRAEINHARSVVQADRLVQKVGGIEAAKLFDDCDGYVKGEFIRGDDVRKALRLLGVN